MDWVLRGLLQSLRLGVPGSDGNLPEVGLGSGAASFSRHGASLFRCGSLAFPCPGWLLDQLRCGAASAARTHQTPSPPLRRCAGSPAARVRHRPKSFASWAPLLEFLKDRPSTSIPVCVHSRLPEVRGCHTRTRSALVVLPDFGGFLRTRLRRFVAPCSRSWGSPGFEPTADFRRHPTLLRGVPLPFEALHQISGSLSPGPLPPRRWSAATQHRCWGRFPRPRGISSDLEFRHAPRCHGPCTSSLGFPRPRPSPEVSVAGGSRWFPRCPVPGGIGSPHSGRCARRGRLPVALLAGCDRGARDGYRVSHGHRAVARTPRMLLPARGSSNDPFDGVILSRVSGPMDHRPEGR